MTASPKLYILTSLFNSSNYKSRFHRYRQFADFIERVPGVVLYTAEGVFPGQSYQYTSADNPRHLQVELLERLWYKENLINMLAATLPDDDIPIAWIDADVIFARPDWVDATVEELQTYDIVQMFSQCQELTDTYTLLAGNLRKGIIYGMAESIEVFLKSPSPYSTYPLPSVVQGHCGYAWAMRRDTWKALNGLLDYPILGSADYIMATAWCGNIGASLPAGMTAGYLEMLYAYEARCKELALCLGYVDGVALHLWHGKRQDRGYQWRDNILIRNAYNPLTDMTYDERGLIRLIEDGSGRMTTLASEVKFYFDSRKEDSATE